MAAPGQSLIDVSGTLRVSNGSRRDTLSVRICISISKFKVSLSEIVVLLTMRDKWAFRKIDPFGPESKNPEWLLSTTSRLYFDRRTPCGSTIFDLSRVEVSMK